MSHSSLFQLSSASALALLLAACATTSHRDVAATFGAEGAGKPKPLTFAVSGNVGTIGEFQIGSLANTAANEFSMVLAKGTEVRWVAQGPKSEYEKKTNHGSVKSSVTIHPAETATKAWTLMVGSLDNYLLTGTLAGQGEEMRVETFPQDFEGDGANIGVDGGYVYKDGKVVAAFDWVHPPDTMLISDTLDAVHRELIIAAVSVMWVQRFDLDMTGRLKPRSPPLGKGEPSPN